MKVKKVNKKGNRCRINTISLKVMAILIAFAEVLPMATAAAEPLTYTGCMGKSSQETLYNFQTGTTPTKPCRQGDVVVSFSSGDITAVIAGTGLYGGGTSGDVTLNVSFAGSGIADTVARSDHNHVHGTLLGLGNDDHIQYLLTNGSRALTGNLSAGNNRITNLGQATVDGDAVPFQQAIKVNDSAGGDLNGTYPNPIVVGLRGRTVSASAPANGQALIWNQTVNQWVAATMPLGVTDHGALTGLLEDDHPQYLTEQRGDARYSKLDHNHDGRYASSGQKCDAGQFMTGIKSDGGIICAVPERITSPDGNFLINISNAGITIMGPSGLITVNSSGVTINGKSVE